MPQIKAAFKAIKISKKKHLLNQRIINEIKTLTKKFNAFADTKNIEGAKKTLAQLIKKIDKAKGRGIIHKKTASRKISRIMKRSARLK